MLERRRTALLLVVLCLGHILLISSQVPSRSGSSALRGAAFGAVAQVQRMMAGVSDGIGGLWSHYFGLRNAARDNDVLRQQVLDLEGRLAAERARGARVDALEEALGLQKTVVAPTLAARVIAGNPVPGVMTINLDRGVADGVTPNMAIINGSGVVGRVIAGLGRSACTVQLLVDRAASAGAALEGSGTTALVSGGFADGNLRMSLLSSATSLAVGERVLTSGQDGIYPSGYVIGHVTQINGTGKSREVVVAPAVNFARLNVVLIVLARPVAGSDAKPAKEPGGSGPHDPTSGSGPHDPR